MIAPEVERVRAPYAAGEREMLEGWLDFHRATLLQKCAGLADDQLTSATCPPSNLTLLGLVRHMAMVERNWFRERFAGEQLDDIYGADATEDAEIVDLANADAEADFATFAEEVALARQVAAGRSLEETFHPRPDLEMNLRWIYVHMIEEYARHNGHADLIRERIDGTTGV